MSKTNRKRKAEKKRKKMSRNQNRQQYLTRIKRKLDADAESLYAASRRLRQITAQDLSFIIHNKD